jgi:hypothetical protein
VVGNGGQGRNGKKSEEENSAEAHAETYTTIAGLSTREQSKGQWRRFRICDHSTGNRTASLSALGCRRQLTPNFRIARHTTAIGVKEPCASVCSAVGIPSGALPGKYHFRPAFWP